MKTVTILYTVRDITSKENFERELKWYDQIKKEMQFFHGGKLVFDYKEDEYLIKMGEEERNQRGIKSIFRLLPRVEELQIYKHTDVSDKDKIEKWFIDYLNYNDSEASVGNMHEAGVEFTVSDKELDDFIYQAERNGFDYSL